MKPRIEKKLSKRLLNIAPTIFKDAWIDAEVMDSADRSRTSISHCYRVGGDLDYWGETTSDYSLWEYWCMNFEWYGSFPQYPKGHRHEYMPNLEGFQISARNLLSLARQCELEKRV